MKKLYFIKQYPLNSTLSDNALSTVKTLEVDFAAIEKELPNDAEIVQNTVQTLIEGDRFIVYGEYEILSSGLTSAVAREIIDYGELPGDEETLPSIN